jgi:hypothetical protein
MKFSRIIAARLSILIVSSDLKVYVVRLRFRKICICLRHLFGFIFCMNLNIALYHLRAIQNLMYCYFLCLRGRRTFLLNVSDPARSLVGDGNHSASVSAKTPVGMGNHTYCFVVLDVYSFIACVTLIIQAPRAFSRAHL